MTVAEEFSSKVKRFLVCTIEGASARPAGVDTWRMKKGSSTLVFAGT